MESSQQRGCEQLTLPAERLREIVRRLVLRPGHEMVRALVHELLVNGIGASESELSYEHRMPEVRGRADALLGRTVLEYKRDLRVEFRDAEEELARYLSDREARTSERFVGIATDGAEFRPYELRRGMLIALSPFRSSRDRPEALLSWLSSAVALHPELPLDPETVRRELGRDSLAFEVAHSALADLWVEARERPDVQVKRALWASLLERVYGSTVDQDTLFFQHTYLTVVAKVLATRALGAELPDAPELLSGKPFHDAGIVGAVESDFFDWLLVPPGGSDLVRRICGQVGRFRLDNVQHDILKGLYESLIDPEQRHDLGEYYTPDWLAERLCARVIDRPLEQRVLDPACGSGTFLFQAIRRLLAAADSQGISNRDALAACSRQIVGMDVHPVAVLIARVTYLLALGEERLRDRPALSIPVYLGDSVQWNTQAVLSEREVRIDVPDGPTLLFPFTVASNPVLFDTVVDTMLTLSERAADATALRAWLARQGASSADETDTLVASYEHLKTLRQAGRNHIWGYVARNLSRPIWLSSPGQRADVVIGNPPWLSFRYMSGAMQERFRDECQRLGVWVGGRGRVSHQDLSAYFFARCAELYVRPEGTIAFVMPYAALSRHHFERFRSGRFASTRRSDRAHLFASVRFVEAWAFDERVQPLFEVPSCVLIAAEGEPDPLPQTVTAYSGRLPRRDATLAQAAAALQWDERSWPSFGDTQDGSPYREVFRNGAIVYPRMLFVVEPARTGRFGGDPSSPLVQSRRSVQEKRPWRTLAAIQGRVERQFLWRLYLGESIAPFRPLGPVLAVIPWNDRINSLLDEQTAERQGYLDLAGWLQAIEQLWRTHGRSDEPITPRLDYYGQLGAQMPPAPLRVLYTKSGTLPAAMVLRDEAAIVENLAYWAAIEDEREAHYLTAILNSDTARERVEHLQSRGQWGARHFDKVMFENVIPQFDPAEALHQDLAAAAALAEEVAAEVDVAAVGFIRARRLIRESLSINGISGRIDQMVSSLLG
jgi:hypothetical protein